METISTNAAAFSASLLALSVEIDGSIKKVIKKACFDLYARIVARTPVDTGRAKGSWGIGITHSDNVLPPGNYDTNKTIDMVSDATNGLFAFTLQNDEIVIYNNLEYISYLEDGSSMQAPVGMVAVSLAEFTAHFQAALATEKVLL